MKKILLTLILCIAFIAVSATVTFAATQITECPDVKIVIDGELSTYSNTPININGRTMLPFREVLVNLGIQNDDQHIIWNASDRSIKVIKDSLEIGLKVDSVTASVYGKAVTIDVAPIIYKDRTYIPARLISQSLGKKVVWDGSSKSVIIRDEAEFNKIKEIMDQSNNAMEQVNKYKYETNMNISSTSGDEQMAISVTGTAEADNKQKVLHVTSTTKMPNQDDNATVEMYYANDTMYMKDFVTSEWISIPVSKESFQKQFSQSSLDSANDAVYAGLVMDSNSKPDEILLKGNVYLDELFSQLTSSLDMKEINFNVSSMYMEISLDKNTNYVNRLSMKVVLSFSLQDSKEISTMEEEFSMTYSDYNGNYDVQVPADVLSSAKTLDQ